MSAFKPTAAQEAAIRSRGSAVLVSAGAGSGKTKVLTERLMSYLTDRKDPKDVDSFLVITFTRAAAGELKGRIMQELAEAAARDPADRHLRRQTALCRRAQISTIHGFCAALLRENSQRAGLAPDFRVIEDDRAEAMRRAALEKVLDACYAAADKNPGFLTLADTVGAGRDDRRLAELVLELHAKMQSHPRPAQWAARMIEQLRAPAADAADTVWGREILKSLSSRAAYWADEMENCLALMRGEAKILAVWGESYAAQAEMLRDFCRAASQGWDRARAALTAEIPKLGTLRASPDPALSDALKARRESCKKSCEAMKKAMAMSSDQQLEGMRLTHDAMEALLALTLAFDEQYKADKRRLSLVDYADLEHLAAELLTDEDDTPTPLARQVAERYTEIMVDEYQDVSRVQDAIFRAVSREGKNLFLVGDVKQSIYRFRLADPVIFTEKYDAWDDYETAAEGAPRRVLLRENFRSRREILDAANAVFSACMSRSLGDVDYDEAAALRCAASYEGAGQKSELLLIPASGAGDEDETPDKLAREAEIVAARIEALLAAGTPVTQDGVTRPAQSGDVAILLRSANKYGAVFRTALLRRGIGVSSAQGKDFFGSEEIASLISLLAVIDNPHRDIDLIAALRAPCFGFTPDELSLIRAEDGKADFYGCLRLRAEHDEKARAFVEKLAALRALAPDVGCAELVWQLIGELDLLAIASAMTDGERRRGNLMELLSLSESFESTGYRGLHRFVLWLRRLAEKGQEVGGAASAGVRILSVHKSKGLEFPIVFFCDLARRFNQSDSMARVLVHPDLGLGAKVTDLQRRIEYPTLARTAIAERLRRETLSEEMRLLYVALTRPKEYLFMTACVKDPEKLIEKARLNAPHSLAPEVLSSAASPLGWLLAAAIRDDGAHIALRLYEERDGREAEMDARPAVVPDAAFGERLARNLAFRYPHADAVGLPSKLTATELKDHAEGDEEAASLAPPRPRRFREPDFSRADKPLRGAERGTATHLVLQYMDFERTDSEQAVRAEIERMRQARYLTDREAEAVDAKAIVTLFSSPLGRRMRAAQTIRREFKFSLLTDARELFGKAGGDKLLLQGVVDCCIEEDGELVVIDYKTDAITTDEELEARSALYTPQLRAYAVAMERIFGKRVKECVLYFLSMGREARVAPDRGGQEGRETT